jgi:hypothetical protein
MLTDRIPHYWAWVPLSSALPEALSAGAKALGGGVFVEWVGAGALALGALALGALSAGALSVGALAAEALCGSPFSC